jgi:hypothetical protein
VIIASTKHMTNVMKQKMIQVKNTKSQINGAVFKQQRSIKGDNDFDVVEEAKGNHHS